jgi:hypothetical protein
MVSEKKQDKLWYKWVNVRVFIKLQENSVKVLI